MDIYSDRWAGAGLTSPYRLITRRRAAPNKNSNGHEQRHAGVGFGKPNAAYEPPPPHPALALPSIDSPGMLSNITHQISLLGIAALWSQPGVGQIIPLVLRRAP